MSNDKSLSLKVTTTKTRKRLQVQLGHAGNRKQPAAAPEQNIDALVAEVTQLAHAVAQPDVEAAPLLVSAETILRNSGRMVLLGDLAAVAVSFIVGGALAYLIKTQLLQNGFEEILSQGTLKQFLVYIGLGSGVLLWLDQLGHYRQRLPFWESTGHIVAASMVGMLVGGFVQFAMQEEFSRMWLALSWLLLGVFLFTGRLYTRKLLHKARKWEIPVLVLGTGDTAQALLRALKTETNMGYDIVAQLPAEYLAGLTQPADWHKLMAKKGAGYILLALEGAAVEQYQPMIRAIVRANLPYTIVPPWLGLPSSGLSPHSFFTHDVMMLHNTNRLTLLLPRIMKRTFDIVVAGGGVLALSPIFLFLAFMVRRDGGDAFLANERVGQHGRKFGCLKFRSMVADNDRILQEYLAANPEAAEEWRKFQKLKYDPRITRFGHFIRKTSLDELPQLLNVVFGDMSLVGPRPILPNQTEMYGDDFGFYTAVRPGISGPWQVSGRNKLTIAQRVQLEAWYARNWSLWMDIVILLKTVPTLMGKGTSAF